MSAPTEIVAVYRVLYGEDFIQESIRSILPYVDKVFVVKAERPWGNTTGVTYKDQWVPWPDKFDNTSEKILELNEPKVEIIEDYWPTPKGQLTHIVNDLILNRCKPNTIVFIEPDHIFLENAAKLAFDEWKTFPNTEASTRQVELWKTPLFCLLERPNRTSVIFHRINGEPMCSTGFNGASDRVSRLRAQVHNFGFCLSEKVMYWKHLTALAFASIIEDSPPNPDWYENKWLNWDKLTNNSDLEISLGYEHTIKMAVDYSTPGLPESIKTRFSIP